jgi:hypothetical protein
LIISGTHISLISHLQGLMLPIKNKKKKKKEKKERKKGEADASPEIELT